MVKSLIAASRTGIAKLAIFALVVVGLYQLHSYIRDSGIKECQLKAATQQLELKRQWEKEREAAVKKALTIQAQDWQDRVTNTEVKEEIKKDAVTAIKIIKEIEKVGHGANCDVVINDVNRMLKQVNQITNRATDTTTDTD